MFGCCGDEQEKIRNDDGTIDQVRLEIVTNGLRTAGWTEDQIARVVGCSCPCHQDGCVCMC